ncbi:hypothetical protein LOTGIDRAFT_238183 [Lottia gigantea]|uniref:Uncharacterized protein n=1 Tax=Lottia gigantea TaxID=225164 RepID=V4CHT7_LOTGI|nr:hypothetical protein LOTGIDRAFT_238183 [Lottia gigantea]ESP01705.1 hypothetical protein LOTGIDRAFT_238183 [Lottia gigantea]
MIPAESLLLIILYISLFCDIYDIICYVIRKLNNADEPLSIKPKYSRDHYHDIVRQHRISESRDEFKDTTGSTERHEIQNKLSEAVKMFQNKKYLPSSESNRSDNNWESMNFPGRKVSRVYTSKATSFLLSQALLDSTQPLMGKSQDIVVGLPSRKVSEDNWEAKRVRSRKISRVLKAPDTTSLLYAKTLEGDSRLKSVPTFEEPESPEI